MKMILNKNFLCGLIVLLISFSIICAIRVSKNKETNKDVNMSPEFQPQHTPAVIRELFQKVKKLSPALSEAHESCLDLMLSAKNGEQMKHFWNDLKNSQIDTSPNKAISRKLFHDFVVSTNETVKIDEVPKPCMDIVTNNLMDLSEIDNATKQKELGEIISPYFPGDKKASTSSGKNIITAFIGVHRDTDIAKKLIPKLNANK